MGLLRFIKNQFRHDRNTKRLLSEQEGQLKALRSLVAKTRLDKLTELTLHSKELGISTEMLCKHELVVSLTSFGNRINEVYLAIESIMQGSVKPNRIVLWLAQEEFEGKTLPQTLLLQQRRGLEIKYCNNIRSYKKIVPAMKIFPDACVVTIDDDMVYEFDLVENLLNAHFAHPDDVCACRTHRITLDECQKPRSYLQWQMEYWPQDRSNLNFLTSGGGALFPPRCFVDDFFDEGMFMSLCPYADDVWINAMVWMSGRHVTKAYTHSKTGCDYMALPFDQDDALSNENTNPSMCRNDVQIKAVMDKYDLYHYLV